MIIRGVMMSKDNKRKKSNFIVAVEKKTVMHRGVLPVKIIEAYLMPDYELKPINVKKLSHKAF